MTWLAWTIETLAGRLAADRADDRLVADEDEPVLGVGAGVIERAGDDLRRAVIAAHRVDGDADPGAVRPRRAGLRLGHRVSARRRLRLA